MRLWVVLVVALGGGLARAQSPDELEAMAGELSLSAEQKQKIHAIADDARKDLARARADREVAEIDLRRALDKDEPDEATVGALVGKLAAAEGAARKAQLIGLVRARKVLSAAQRKALAARSVGAGTGTIQITSEPAGAEIILDGRVIGRSPLRLDQVSAGVHRIEARKSGHSVSRAVTVEAGQTFSLDLRLGDAPPADASGHLIVNTTPWARVHVDGKEAGTTPLSMTLKPGKHTVTLEAEGQKFIFPVIIEPGQSVKLVKKLPVR